MPSRDNLVKAGLSATQAAAIQGTSADALVALGTTQANALALPADICRFATVAAGTGAIINPVNAGDSGTVQNAGANALLLYPPVGAKINALGVNAGYSVATATPSVDWYAVSPTQIIASQGA